MNELFADLGISLQGTWPPALRTNLELALNHIGHENLRFWFNNKPVTLRYGGEGKSAVGSYSGLTERFRVTFFANRTANPVINILHEFGHLFDNVWDDFFTNNLQKETFLRDKSLFGGWDGGKYRSLPGRDMREKVLKAERIAGGDAWQQRGGTAHFEDWADIFSNAILGNIDTENEIGRQLLEFVARMEAHIGISTASGGTGTGSGSGSGTIPPKSTFDTKDLPTITPTLAIKIIYPVLNLRSNTNVTGGVPSGSITGNIPQNSIHQVFEVVRVNDRIWAKVGTNKWAVVERRDSIIYAEFVQTGGGDSPPPPPPPPISTDPFDNKILPAVTPTLAIKVLASGLNLRKTTETRIGLPIGALNGTLNQNAVKKVLEVVRLEDRIWARVGTEQWAVVEKRDGTRYAEFINA